MKLRLVAFLCSLAILAAFSAVFASDAAAATSCHPGSVPTPGSTIKGGLVVDGVCRVTGLTVNGGVTVTSAGRLTMFDSTVNGGISVEQNGELDLGFDPQINRGSAGSTVNGGITLTGARDLDIWNSRINGGLVISGTFEVNFFPTVCGNEIQGAVAISDVLTRPAGAFFIFGDALHNTIFGTPCPGNTIHGSVKMTNSKVFEFEDNTITGSVMLDASQLELNGNTVGGSLHCTSATVILPPSPGDVPNTVGGSNTCP